MRLLETSKRLYNHTARFFSTLRFGLDRVFLRNFLRIGLPAISLLAVLGGCGSGKSYHTFETDPGTWERAAAELCPDIPNYNDILTRLNYGDATPKEADTRWFYIRYLQGGFRIAVPDPLCPKPGEKPIEVVPLPEPLRPTPDAGVAEVREEVLKPDVYEVNPDAGVADVPADVPPDAGVAEAVTEVIPDVRPEVRRPPKKDGGETGTQPPVFIP
jgi:hypothetical protein